MRLTPSLTSSLILPLGLAALLVGCASSSPRSEPQRVLIAYDGPVAEVPASARPRLVVRAVSVPDYLDRRELMRRTGANTVVKIDDAVWAERPAKSITRYIAQALAAQRADVSVEAYSTTDGRSPDAVLAISLEDFAAGSDGVLHLRGSYVYAPNGKTAVQSGRVDADAPPAGGGVEANVAALQAALAQAVKKLAAELPAISASTAPNH